ncbi:hypothetical protein QAD02_017967, partial [Eretmocerus hayati]
SQNYDYSEIVKDLIEIETMLQAKNEPLDIDFEAIIQDLDGYASLAHPKEERHSNDYHEISYRSTGLEHCMISKSDIQIINHEHQVTDLDRPESTSVNIENNVPSTEFGAIIDSSLEHPMLYPKLEQLGGGMEDISQISDQSELTTLLRMQKSMDPEENGISTEPGDRKQDCQQNQFSNDGLESDRKICSKKSSKRLEYEEHMESHNTTKSKPHEQFGKEFQSKDCLEKQPNSRVRTFWSCDVCNKAYETEEYLKMHSKTHSKNKVFTCEICAENFTRKGNLIFHLNKHTNTESVSCKLCDKIFWHKNFLKIHMLTHCDERLFKCADCGKGFNGKTNIRHHVKCHMRSFSCNVCDKKFNYNHHLKLHMITHTSKKPFSCHHCSKSFSTKMYLATHMKSHGDRMSHSVNTHEESSEVERRFPCDMCKRKFRDSLALKNHIEKVHSRNDRSQCHLCHKSYSTKSNLSTHLKVHSAEEIFPCKICKSKFPTESILLKHMRQNHHKNSLDCKICGKRCSSKSILKIHIAAHGREKVSCKICSKSFRDTDLLVKHEESHRNEDRPCICDFCGCRFFDNWSLKMHIKRHTNDKPFECDICGKKWKRKTDITKHLRSHMNERPFPCNMCPSKFQEKWKLTRHVMARHREKSKAKPIVHSRKIFSIP